MLVEMRRRLAWLQTRKLGDGNRYLFWDSGKLEEEGHSVRRDPSGGGVPASPRAGPPCLILGQIGSAWSGKYRF